MSGSFKWVWGFLFWVWIKWGNLAGSRMKKTGVLLNTQSQLPSSVFNLTANPRGSRAVSADPTSPPTVEKRTVTSTSAPLGPKRGWEVISLKSSVTVTSLLFVKARFYTHLLEPSKKMFAWEDRYIIHCSGASAMLTIVSCKAGAFPPYIAPAVGTMDCS